MTRPAAHSVSFLKRAFDCVGAATLLLLLAPVLAVMAVALWLDDGRPILFTQMRAGQHGEPFRLYKFRTLHTGPKDPTRPADHTTTLGAPLRRWALDELPQLWHVLRGDMSLVGPRPAPLDQAAHYGPHERRRLHVPPGLTGWAQIHGRNALSWPERIEYDRWYVQNRSFPLDLYILLQTPRVLITGNGVYGPRNENSPFSSTPPSPHA
jgi:lipopolysaccharide/colanic/teichoic acid biosynthesis glycosyltransferase